MYKQNYVLLARLMKTTQYTGHRAEHIQLSFVLWCGVHILYCKQLEYRPEWCCIRGIHNTTEKHQLTVEYVTYSCVQAIEQTDWQFLSAQVCLASDVTGANLGSTHFTSYAKSAVLVLCINYLLTIKIVVVGIIKNCF